MMSLRIYWRAGAARRCAAELVVIGAAAWSAPVLAGPDPRPVVERVTAREAIERQFAAEAVDKPRMSGAEATRIMENYHARIGKMLEPKRDTSGGRADR